MAAICVDHVHHAPSQAAYLSATKNSSGCAAHSLAEVYATLTRLPGKQRMTCQQALLFVDDIRKRLTIVALDEDEYWLAITESVAEGIIGGTIYDTLIARCALKARATIIYTWNLTHFRRLRSEIAKSVATP